MPLTDLLHSVIPQGKLHFRSYRIGKIRMHRAILKFFAGLLYLTAFLSFSSIAGTPTNPSLAPMLQKVLPSVVNIRAIIKPLPFRMPDASPQQRENNENQDNPLTLPENILSVGSGVIVDADKGYVLTNAHVIDDAQTITVTLGDGRHFTAKVIGIDKPSDIALLQIPAKNLTVIVIADSNSLKVGDYVAAIGNPFGLSQTVTSGIVSALGRTTLGLESFENFIQTDAPINPGNSGGALINMQGELIGISTAILAPDRTNIGIGFAIPSNMAKSIMQQLIEYGDVKRGALGIGAQDVTPELASAFNLKDTKGAIVTLVMANSPAQKAGLEIGDIIKSVNGSVIKNSNDVVNTIGFLRVDSKIRIEILRHHKTLQLSTVLTDPKKRQEINQNLDPFLYGVGLKDFSLFSPIHGKIEGVLVVSVEGDSNAWQSDLRPGDVIISANQQQVTSITALRKIISNEKHVVLNILRGPGAIFIVISGEH